MPSAVKASGLLLVIAYIGFISLGLPDPLIGVAWPSVRDSFHLQQSALALIFVGAGLGNFVSSFFTGKLLGVMGIGMLLATSSALVALSLFGYAFAGLWLLFAACAVVHGLGSGAIDAGLNHYVAHHFSARHMNWLHACYSLGATCGPLIMTAAIAGSGAWRTGYLNVAIVLSVLALLFTFTHRRWDEPLADGAPSEATPPTAGLRETLRHRTVWLQVLLFFFYTGLEVTVGQWSFTVLTESRRATPESAGLWVTVFWGSIGVGRVLFGFVVDRVGIDRLLRLSTAAAAAGAALFAIDVFPAGSVVALALTGLGLAAIYPCMMTRTPQRIGRRFAAHAIGFQVSAAMIGAAALPSLAGLMAQLAGLEAIPATALVMAVAIFFIHERLLRCPS